MIFAWHFANRFFSSKPIGNFYAQLPENINAATTAVGLAKRLVEVVETYVGWHAAFFDATSLPAWLQDVIVNSMSNWRSAFMTEDGRWRQWEAYDCVDIGESSHHS